ncbi:MAG: hypothetical protein AAB011_14560 [Candidatus Eisenbacteria bacterium]
MPLETFTGVDLPSLFARAQTRFGEDAVVLSVRRLGSGPWADFELVASDADSAGDSRRAPIVYPAPSAPLRACAPGNPMVLAVVGPTGAGKTTTLAKLAMHPRVFSGRRVGFVCLDTHRVGAIEEAARFASLARAPHAVVYDEHDLKRARRALKRCDILLVDTAGRGPRRADDDRATRALLDLLDPAETHLVLPAGLDRAHARRLAERYRELGATHLLASKLDEAPESGDYALLAEATGLRCRWVADGQDVPGDLRGSTKAVSGGERAARGGARAAYDAALGADLRGASETFERMPS